MSSIRDDIERVIDEIRGNHAGYSAYFFVLRTGHAEDDVIKVLTELCGQGVISLQHGKSFDTYHVSGN